MSLTRREALKAFASLSLGIAVDRFLPYQSMNIAAQERSSPNVLIIVLDTLSAHNMSLYSYSRETTPNIARWAERATVYHRHYAGGNFTPPGTGSILTGTYPWTHRGLNGSGTLLDLFEKNNLFSFLCPDYHVVTYTHNSLVMFLLAQMQADIDNLITLDKFVLQENTLAGRSSPDHFAIRDWSETLIRGYGQPPSSLFLSLLEPLIIQNRNRNEEFISLFPRGIPSAGINSRYFLLEDVIDWIISSVGSLPKPCLGYFHLIPPHEPYCARKEFIGRFDDDWLPPQKQAHFFSNNMTFEQLIQQRQHYDEYLAYADAEFGRLVERLERNDQLENTYLILTSDHGQLFERGIHGHITPVMYEPLLHIPLIISSPGQLKRQDIYSLTSAVDLLPSIMHITDRSIPNWCEGKLLPGLGGKGSKDRHIFSLEAKESSKWGVLDKGTAVVLQDHYKLIHYFGYNGYDDVDELYNLDDDPDELENLAKAHPDLVCELKDVLREKMVGANAWE